MTRCRTPVHAGSLRAGSARTGATNVRRRGNVAIMTAFLAIPLITLPGIAVDSARVWLVQSRLQVAVDAGVLAAARTTSQSSNAADGIALFNANFQPIGAASGTGYFGSIPTTPLITQPAASTTKMTGSAAVPLTLIAALGNQLGFSSVVVTAGATAISQSTGLEVSLVLDNTGSMVGWPIQAVVTSASTLVNILYGSGPQDTIPNLWVSVVPFTAEVNIGNSHASWLASSSYVASKWSTAGWKGCVMARVQNGNDSTDATPAQAPFTPYLWASTLGKYKVGNQTIIGDNDWSPTNITEQNQTTLSPNTAVGPNLGCTAQPILPETTSRTTVLQAVAQSTATFRGGTFINLGLQAGWWTISPNWQGLWGLVGLPQAYNTPHMRKVIVLMTDGNNLWNDWGGGAPGAGPSPWVNDGDTDYSAYGRLNQNLIGNVPNTQANATTTINTRMSQMCTTIKQQGITIYTILFNHDNSVSAATQALFSACASTPSDYFLSATGADLQNAFSQIGGQLSNLRLSL